MHFIRKIVITILVFIPVNVWSQLQGAAPKVQGSWLAPLDIPLFLSGNYGEIRTDHFHAGLDFKTQKTEGKQVLASDSGSVWRVSVASGGYGHAVYLKHPGGSITVYGHLQHFEPALEQWVKSQQYHKKSFEVNLFPPAGRFVYGRGACIGFSGNTGYSGGPHLHFEIRDKSGEIPLNGLRFGFNVADTIPPVIRRIAIYPMDRSSSVNGIGLKCVEMVSDSIGREGPLAIVHGRIGFGVETYDFLNGSANVCSPYSVSLFIDNRLQFRFVLDNIPFALAGFMNSHVDYAEMVTTGHAIQKLFLDPGNRLKIYPVTINRGIATFTDGLEHNVRISVEDAYGNRIELPFRILSTPVQPRVSPAEPISDSLAVFGFDRANIFVNSDIRLSLPAGALFDNCVIRFHAHRVDSLPLSPMYTIGSETIPLQAPAKLTIRTAGIPRSLRDKVFIAGLTYKGSLIPFGGRYKDGAVTATVKSLGRFFLKLDTIVPVIQPEHFSEGDSCLAGQKIVFRIADQGSGIRRYAGTIDRQWALFEYDGKNDLLAYTVDETRLTKRENHYFEITVTDERGNIARYRSSFFF